MSDIGIFRVDDPYYYADRTNGAAVEFLASVDDDTYKTFAERTPLVVGNDYDSYEELVESGYLDDDYLDIYVTVWENGSVEAVITVHGEGECYPVPLSKDEQDELYTFVSQYCDKYEEKSLSEMFEEANEGRSPLREADKDVAER